MTSLSINQKKLIRGLARKKIRQETGLFLVEGDKMVRELLLSAFPGITRYEIQMIVATADWLDEFGEHIDKGIETLCIKNGELRQVSGLQQPNRAVAVVKQTDYQLDIPSLQKRLSLALETVQDPGNMGAIIRTADWFGVRDILCSKDCVELYNPKVIQSTMGSFLRVRVHFTNLPELIKEVREQTTLVRDAGGGDIDKTTESSSCQIFGTSGNGKNLYKASLPSQGIIMLGNESRGLSEKLCGMADRVLSIPHYDPDMHAESLNVATAAAVFCAEFRRQGL